MKNRQNGPKLGKIENLFIGLGNMEPKPKTRSWLTDPSSVERRTSIALSNFSFYYIIPLLYKIYSIIADDTIRIVLSASEWTRFTRVRFKPGFLLLGQVFFFLNTQIPGFRILGLKFEFWGTFLTNFPPFLAFFPIFSFPFFYLNSFPQWFETTHFNIKKHFF